MRLKRFKSKTVFDKLIQPLTGLVQQCSHKRKCSRLTDRQWIETGLPRILSQEPSGRAFVQKLFDSGRSVITRTLFFETLKSNRRLKLCRQVSLALYEKMRIDHQQADPFDRLPKNDTLYETIAEITPELKAALNETKAKLNERVGWQEILK
jgi:hypothetical protein